MPKKEEPTINHYYAYTQTGKYHQAYLKENQDIYLHDENDATEAVALADGVSSSRFGKRGAEIACETVMHILMTDGALLFDIDKKLLARAILDRILEKIAMEPAAEFPSDCASTLAFACLDKNSGRLLTFTLGDTLLYVISDNHCRLVSQPDVDVDGRCCVTTTRGAYRRVNIALHDASDIKAVMLCTDGAWQYLYEETFPNEELHNEIISGNYDALKYRLQAEKPDDDNSFIVMKLA